MTYKSHPIHDCFLPDFPLQGTFAFCYSVESTKHISMIIGEFYGLKNPDYTQRVSRRIWVFGGGGLLHSSLKEYPDMAQNRLGICTSFFSSLYFHLFPCLFGNFRLLWCWRLALRFLCPCTKYITEVLRLHGMSPLPEELALAVSLRLSIQGDR